MEQNILNTIKKLVGPSINYGAFDVDLITHINTTFFIVYQLGATEEPFVIHDGMETWDDFHSGEELELIKTYVYLKARMYFDPPTNSALISAINEQIKELESRLNYEVD